MTHLVAVVPWQILLVLVFVFIFIIPFIIALIDILKREFTGNNKIVWLLVVLLSNFLGVILYFIMGRKQKVLAKIK